MQRFKVTRSILAAVVLSFVILICYKVSVLSKSAKHSPKLAAISDKTSSSEILTEADYQRPLTSSDGDDVEKAKFENGDEEEMEEEYEEEEEEGHLKDEIFDINDDLKDDENDEKNSVDVDFEEEIDEDGDLKEDEREETVVDNLVYEDDEDLKDKHNEEEIDFEEDEDEDFKGDNKGDDRNDEDAEFDKDKGLKEDLIENTIDEIAEYEEDEDESLEDNKDEDSEIEDVDYENDQNENLKEGENLKTVEENTENEDDEDEALEDNEDIDRDNKDQDNLDEEDENEYWKDDQTDDNDDKDDKEEEFEEKLEEENDKRDINERAEIPEIREMTAAEMEEEEEITNVKSVETDIIARDEEYEEESHVKRDINSYLRADTKPDPRVDTRADTKPDPRVETRADAKAERRPELMSSSLSRKDNDQNAISSRTQSEEAEITRQDSESKTPDQVAPLPEKSLQENESLIPGVGGQEVTPSSGRQQVLVMTHALSNISVLTGAIRQHPGVFQFHEPLAPYRLAALKAGSPEDKIGQAQIALMKAYFNCDPLGLAAQPLETVAKMLGGVSSSSRGVTEGLLRYASLFGARDRGRDDTRALFACLNGSSVPTPEASALCYRSLVERCLANHVTLVKATDFNPTLAETLMRELPDLKILYLVRDPRAAFASSHPPQGNPTPSTDITEATSLYCRQLSRDVMALQMWPSRARIVRYEDLADDPVQISRAVFNFLSLSWSRDIEEFVSGEARWLQGKRGEITKQARDADIGQACGDTAKSLGY